MKLSLEQFRERLVDYLYGELEGEALREFEACLAESEAARSELAAHQRTLSAARAVLVRDDQAPPARVRAAVLAAAAASVSAKQTVPVPEPRASVWSFLRLPWLVPTFGVAAAVALFALGREVESPELPPQSEHSAPAAYPSAVPSTAVRESAGAAAESQGAGEPVPSKLAAQSDGVAPSSGSASEKARSRGGRSRIEAKGYAVPPPAWAGDRSSERRKSEASEERAPTYESEAREPPGAAADRATSEPARGAGSGAAAASPQAAGSALGGASRDQLAAAPASPAQVGAVRRAEPSDDGAASPKKSASASPYSSRETLVERAHEQTARAQWTEARETYRLLLRRHAGDEQAPVWRRALAALERAEADAGR